MAPSPSAPKLPPTVLNLPVSALVPELLAALDDRGVAVLSAEPGAGKSTAVPLYLLGASWASSGKILLLQPRRVAALALAQRMAGLLGEHCGQTVGYRVSLETSTGPATRLEVITEGILTRMVQDNPELPGIAGIIFDEFHERGAQGDLALSFCLDVRASLRPDLRLLVMSATMDTVAISGLLGSPPAPVFQGQGSLFPVELRYLPPPPGKTFWQDGRAFCSWVAGQLGGIFAESQGDLLVFLPGRWEIERVGQDLAADIPVRVLHGSVPLHEQAAVLAPSTQRRVILSTSLAETSLTIPGVRVVVDAGISRFDRFDPALAMNRLVSERVASFSARQRTGRAGRVAPGKAIRLWNQSETLALSLPPEIERSDLGPLVLEAFAWGVRSPEELKLASPVSSRLWQLAVEVLTELGLLELVDDSGSSVPAITPRGREALGFGTHPRLGALLLSARGGPVATASILASWMDEPSLAGPSGAEVARVLADLLAQTQGSASGLQGSPGRFVQRALRHAWHLGFAGKDWPSLRALYQADQLSILLARALPDRIGRCLSRGPQVSSYQLVSGRQAVLKQGHGPEYLVVTEAEAGSEQSLIRSFAGLPDSFAGDIAARAQRVVEVQWAGLVPKARMVNRFGGLVLSDAPASWQDPAVPRAMARQFLDRFAKEGLALLPWNPGSTSFLYRLRFWARQTGQGDFSDEALVRDGERWLRSFLRFEPGKQVIQAPALLEALENLVPWDQKKEFERLAPGAINLPSGRRRNLEYGPRGTEQPVLSLRIQEAFGYREHPCAGKVPLLLHLLSPARRPLQITSDLPGFWAGSYQDVRKDMRGRYPKHPWPENPHEVQESDD